MAMWQRLGQEKQQHITPHRAWAYVQARGSDGFEQKERDHILRCERCLHLLLLCLESDSFGDVLGELSKG